MSRQTFRGERWHVLENPLANQFFRIHPAAWEFVGRLAPDRTVDEVWRECLERFPDRAPGQEAAVRLLGQLYQSGLLQYPDATDAAVLFARQEKRTRRELRARLMNVMFFRIPLWDPDRFLVGTLPWVRWWMTPAGMLVWLGVVLMGLKAVVDGGPAAWDQAQGILAPGNLPMLYAALVVLKGCHELGHAWMCRRYGGEVHTLGLMFMIFTPVPYVDVTSSWGFRSRGQRILVGLGGMLVELLVAAVAAVVWSRTGPGAVHSIAYNLIFVAGVTTLVFNANPLLRFDGYYVLSDWLGIPNLGPRANRHWRYLVERHAFGVTRSVSPAQTRSESAWLTVYGLGSGVYRVLVFGAMLLAVADRYLLLGVVMLVTCVVAWVVVPVAGLVRYLATDPVLDRCRWRAVSVVAGVLAVLLVAAAVIPFPNHFRAPGIVVAAERSYVIASVAGRVVRRLVEPGAAVEAGQALMVLENPELALELRAAAAAVEENELRMRAALGEQAANLKPLLARQNSLTNRLGRLRLDELGLTVRAAQSGIWVAPEVIESVGRWVPRGAPLGMVVGEGRREFVGTVPQSDADRLFRLRDPRAEVRLRGEAGKVLSTGRVRIVPGDTRDLPSASLGWMAGGEIATVARDPGGRVAAESFFEVRAPLPDGAGVRLVHGRTGRMRFELPPEPLLQQGWRRLLQLLQRRYGI